MIVCGPTAVGEYETAQELETKPLGLVVEPESVHVGLEKVPVFDQLTVPVGVVAIPPGVVSVTVAVQVVEVPAVNEPGVQLAVVMVERLVTVTLVDPELTEWLVSPA